MRSNFTSVGIHLLSCCIYPSLSPQNFRHLSCCSCHIFVGTRVEEEANKLCSTLTSVVVWNRMSLHLSLSSLNMALPLIIGVIFRRHNSARRTMPSSLTSVWVWNRNTCYLATPYVYSALFRQITLIIGVNDFEFFVGLTVQEGTNKLCVALSLVLECRIVAASISLHLPQGQHNLTIPLRMSISHA